MKKLISILTVALMIIATSVVCLAAEQPDPARGYSIFAADDFTYLSLVCVDDGSEFEDEEWFTNGTCHGASDGVQVWVDQGHLWSHHSWAIMPTYQIEVEFDGTGFHLGANFRDTGSAGIVVVVDGVETEGCVFDDTVAAIDGSHIIPTRIVRVENLEDGHHKIVIYGTTAVRLSSDWYEIKFSAPATEETPATDSANETEPKTPDTNKPTTDDNKPATDSSKPAEEAKSNTGLIIGIVIAAVVVVAAIVAAVVAKKKK